MSTTSKLRHLEDPSTGTEADDHHFKTDAEILIEAVVAMSETRSVGEIGLVLCVAVGDLSAADGTSFIVKEGDHCLYIESLAPTPLFKGQSIPQQDCIAGWCMRMSQYVDIADIHVEERLPIHAYRSTFVKSLIVVPIGKTEPFAAISAYWAIPHSRPPEKVRILQLLADAAEVAIHDMVRGRESGERIARLKLQSSGLMRAARSPMVGRGEAPGMFRLITEQLIKVISANEASVWLLDASSQRLVCQDTCEHPDFKHSIHDFSPRCSEFPGYFGKLETGQHLIVEVPAQVFGTDSTAIRPLLSPQGTYSEMVVGLQMANALAGVICLSSNEARHWQDDEIQFLLALASQLQITLATEHLKNAEEQLAELNAQLDQLVRERTSKLEVVNAELDAFAKTLSHDLKALRQVCWMVSTVFGRLGVP
ncbi:MAG: GAF domain-containing protein [Verrucomicrobiaceae bacterium]|nr:GAF domain-containing protein [Verrucomicrobiaceae bacterium]NCF94286.1 GAF domain-containing protein [Verrucomicrobiaceae bacterium]